MITFSHTEGWRRGVGEGKTANKPTSFLGFSCLQRDWGPTWISSQALPDSVKITQQTLRTTRQPVSSFTSPVDNKCPNLRTPLFSHEKPCQECMEYKEPYAYSLGLLLAWRGAAWERATSVPRERCTGNSHSPFVLSGCHDSLPAPR